MKKRRSVYSASTGDRLRRDDSFASRERSNVKGRKNALQWVSGHGKIDQQKHPSFVVDRGSGEREIVVHLNTDDRLSLKRRRKIRCICTKG